MSDTATRLEPLRYVDLMLGDEIEGEGLVTSMAFDGPSLVLVATDDATVAQPHDPHAEVVIVRPDAAPPRERYEARALRVGARLSPEFAAVIDEIAAVRLPAIPERSAAERDALVTEVRNTAELEAGEYIDPEIMGGDDPDDGDE